MTTKTLSQFAVWRRDRVIGCCDTLQSAKAYARRNGNNTPEQFKITDLNGTILATCNYTLGQRMKWAKP